MRDRRHVHQLEAEVLEDRGQNHRGVRHGRVLGMGLDLMPLTMEPAGGTGHVRSTADSVPTPRYDMKDTITRRWSTPPKDRRRLDRLDDEAGEALRLLVEGNQTLLALVLEQSESWVSRQVRGASGSVQARLNQALRSAAEKCRRLPGKVRAGAPLAGGMAVLVDTFAEFQGVELRRLMLAACAMETRDQADEDVREMDLVQLLERLGDHPAREEAEEALAILVAYESASLKEIGGQLTVLAGARALRRRLEEVARGVH